MLTNQYPRPAGNLYRMLDKLASLFIKFVTRSEILVLVEVQRHHVET